MGSQQEAALLRYGLMAAVPSPFLCWCRVQHVVTLQPASDFVNISPRKLAGSCRLPAR